MEHKGFLRFSQTRPQGWLRNYMHRDLNGFIGHLDELVPGLIKEDDIFGADRRTESSAGSSGENLGVAVVDNQATQYRWWNAETQGNWMDGFVRTACLIEEPQMLKKATDYVKKYLATQDADGYIGIYQEDLRFSPGRENGEFWGQSAIFRALLAYYDYTRDDSVLQAVLRAVKLIMEAYPIGSDLRPFDNREEDPKSWCTGIGHGLTIVDAFYTLYTLTGDKGYWDYAVWLYERFNVEKGENMFEDIFMRNLLNEDYGFHCHAVHTYEQPRALVLAAYNSDDPDYQKALKIFLDKVENLYTCPSGGPIGDEDVRPEGYDPSVTGYEYCNIHELLHTYALLMELSGDLAYGEKIERLAYNAGLGAHLPYESSITYCKSDNSYSMCGDFHQEQPHSHYGAVKQTRYKYSPAHQDVAVCCVPNAGRLMPYLVQSMWIKDGDTLTKAVYGPSQVRTDIGGVGVCITEESNYPFATQLVLRIVADKPVTFTLRLRKPSWARAVKMNGIDVQVEGDALVIRRSWEGEMTLSVDFAAQAEIMTDRLGDGYVVYGPLVMALPIPGVEEITKEHPVPGMYDKHIAPAQDAYYDYSLDTAAPLAVHPGEEYPRVCAGFIDNQTGEAKSLELLPVGKTVLRRLTFPKK